MSSSAENSSSQAAPTQDTVHEGTSTIKRVNWNFSLPTSRRNSSIENATTPGSAPQNPASKASSSQAKHCPPVPPGSDIEGSSQGAPGDSFSQHSPAPSSSIDRIEPRSPTTREGPAETEIRNVEVHTDPANAPIDQILPVRHQLIALDRAAGIREMELTAEEVEAENIARTAKVAARIAAELPTTAGDRSSASPPVSDPQVNNKRKQSANQNNTSKPPSLPQEQKSELKSLLPPKPRLAPTPPPVKQSVSAIRCPECNTLLRMTLTRSIPSALRSAVSPSSSKPSSYKPSSSKQSEASSAAKDDGEKIIYPYPPRLASFKGCQACWEMVHNEFEPADPLTPSDMGTKCCGISCRCLDTLHGAAEKVWGACVKTMAEYGCFGECWKPVEELPLVNEKRKKREVRRGKGVDRSGNGDGDGFEMIDMGGKGKSKEDDGGVGGMRSDEQSGESSGSQRAQGLGNDGQGVQGEQGVVMSGALDGGESVGVPRETEYDRKLAEQAKKSPWQRLAGAVSLKGRR
ncbi:hypothetical protein N431DRAFT_463350 [Stipitochalara longipes BDJ]|nr:hypothetical protein N431DRAFT_463350 [Stipitochalara longipes BDJ]